MTFIATSCRCTSWAQQPNETTTPRGSPEVGIGNRSIGISRHFLSSVQTACVWICVCASLLVVTSSKRAAAEATILADHKCTCQCSRSIGGALERNDEKKLKYLVPISFHIGGRIISIHKTTLGGKRRPSQAIIREVKPRLVAMASGVAPFGTGVPGAVMTVAFNAQAKTSKISSTSLHDMVYRS